MSDPVISTDQLDVSKHGLDNYRRVIANRDGPIGPRLVAQIEAIEPGFICPPGWGPNDLRAKLNELQNRELPRGNVNSDWTRYDKAWNDLCKLWAKAKAAGLRTEEQRPVPKSPPEVTRADAEAMEQIFRELSFELGEFESTTPAERRLQKIEAEQQRLSHAQFYLLKKLNEVIDHINNPRPTNVLHGGPYLAASNGAD